LSAQYREANLDQVAAELGRLASGDPQVETLIERLRREFPRLRDLQEASSAESG
jgi:hypothetical protein